MSLGLQGLFSHRAGKPGPKHLLKTMPSSVKMSLTDSQAARRNPEPFSDKGHYTSSSACSQHSAQMERNNCVHSSLNEPSLTSSLLLLDTMSLPSEERNPPSSAVSSYTTTEDSFPYARNTAYNQIEPRHEMSFHSHSLRKPDTLEQWSAEKSATRSTVSHMTFQEQKGEIAHTGYRSLEPASSGSPPTWRFPDSQAEMNANAFTFQQLNDFKGMECGVFNRHGMPYNDWNIPSWTSKTNAVQQGY